MSESSNYTLDMSVCDNDKVRLRVKTVVIMRIFAGLGNQQFQLAFGLYLAKKYNCELKIDTSYFSRRYRPIVQRDVFYEFSLSKIFSLTNFTGNFEKEFIGLVFYKLLVARSLRKLFRRLPLLPDILTNQRDFPISTGRRNYIQGYFQNWQEIETVRNEMLDLYCLKEGLSEGLSALHRQMSSCSSVSVHFRRGDYVSGRKGVVDTFVELSPGYYREALSVIDSACPIERVYVFSNDHAWVKDNFACDFDVVFVDCVWGDDADVIEQYLMKSCRHNVIANSTFSWMAGWLNTNAEKLVCYPDRWFTDSARKNDIYFPPEWLCIQAE